MCDKAPILRKEQINDGLWMLWEVALRGDEWCQPRRAGPPRWRALTGGSRCSSSQKRSYCCYRRIMPLISLHLCPSWSKHCISFSFFIFYWNKSAICSATLRLGFFLFFPPFISDRWKSVFQTAAIKSRRAESSCVHQHCDTAWSSCAAAV